MFTTFKYIYTFLYSLFIGDELLFPYMFHCSEREMDPSGKGFFAWCKEVKDPNYM